jgi:hypothetical protein
VLGISGCSSTYGDYTPTVAFERVALAYKIGENTFSNYARKPVLDLAVGFDTFVSKRAFVAKYPVNPERHHFAGGYRQLTSAPHRNPSTTITLRSFRMAAVNRNVWRSGETVSPSAVSTFSVAISWSCFDVKE